MTFDGLDFLVKLLLAANGLTAIVLFIVARILKRKRKLTVDSKRFMEMVVDSPEWDKLEADVLESKLNW